MSSKSIALTTTQMNAYVAKRNEEAHKNHAAKVELASKKITGLQSDLRSTVADYTKRIAAEQQALLSLVAPKTLTIGDLFGKDVEAAVAETPATAGTGAA